MNFNFKIEINLLVFRSSLLRKKRNFFGSFSRISYCLCLWTSESSNAIMCCWCCRWKSIESNSSIILTEWGDTSFNGRPVIKALFLLSFAFFVGFIKQSGLLFSLTSKWIIKSIIYEESSDCNYVIIESQSTFNFNKVLWTNKHLLDLVLARLVLYNGNHVGKCLFTGIFLIIFSFLGPLDDSIKVHQSIFNLVFSSIRPLSTFIRRFILFMVCIVGVLSACH